MRLSRLVIMGATVMALAGCGAAVRTATGPSTASSPHPAASTARTSSTSTSQPTESTTTTTTVHPTNPAGPGSCPTDASPAPGGGCVMNNGTCPGPLVANAQGNQVCPEASLAPQHTPSTTTAASTDCQHDGTGGGTWVAADNQGAGACEYSIDVSQWCQRSGASYTVVSPPGVFLVLAFDEGSGFATFRWSAGTQSSARVC